jgi:response regulator NasT
MNGSSSSRRSNIGRLGDASSPLRILLAEDDRSVAEGFRLVLKEAGYQVVGLAYDGIEAVEKAASLSPDMILMDIKMPRMDGLEAAKAINNNPGQNFIPIILVTAYADKQLILRAKSRGVLGYLVKPVHVDDLVPAIEMAQSIAQTINALEGVVENLSEELEARKLIEKAKGILMKHLGVDEENAMRMMQKESRRQRIKLKDLARAIIASHAVLS